MEAQHQGIDRPVIVVIASHHIRQKSMGDIAMEAFVGVSPTTLGRVLVLIFFSKRYLRCQSLTFDWRQCSTSILSPYPLPRGAHSRYKCATDTVVTFCPKLYLDIVGLCPTMCSLWTFLVNFNGDLSKLRVYKPVLRPVTTGVRRRPSQSEAVDSDRS